MKTIAMKSLLSAAALSLTVGLSMNAAADPVSETFVHGNATEAPSVTLTYAASELDTAAGRAALERKVERAAEKVCGPLNYRDAGGLSRLSKNEACYENALAEGMNQLSLDQVAVLNR